MTELGSLQALHMITRTPLWIYKTILPFICSLLQVRLDACVD